MTQESPPRHGSPEDRGFADAWYHRPFRPHSRYNMVRNENLTKEEIAAYRRGFNEGEQNGGKDYK